MTTETKSNVLTPLFVETFKILLEDSRTDATRLSRLRELFKKFGLTSYRTESPFKPKEIEIDKDKLYNIVYRRRLARALLAPRPSPYVYHTLSMDADVLNSATGREYIEALSRYMAEILTAKLGDMAPEQVLMVSRLTPEDLVDFLSQHKLYELEGDKLSEFILRRMVEKCIDRNPTFLKIKEDLAQTAESARSELARTMQEHRETHFKDFSDKLGKIVEEATRQADAYIEVLKTESAERAEKERLKKEEEERIALANAGKSEDDLFREAVIARERQWRKDNPTHPLVKWLMLTGGLAITLGMLFFGEVNGTNLYELLSSNE